MRTIKFAVIAYLASVNAIKTKLKSTEEACPADGAEGWLDVIQQEHGSWELGCDWYNESTWACGMYGECAVVYCSGCNPDLLVATFDADGTCTDATGY